MVDRYNMIGRDVGARMDVSPNGVWVRYCDLAAAHAEIERLRSLMIEAKQRLSYDAETFHDQGCWDREDACLAIMKRIDAALALPPKHAGQHRA